MNIALSSLLVPQPLERIAAPAGLLGGPNPVYKGIPCTLDATSDLQACRLWISKSGKSEGDIRRKRTIVEKLLNWAYLVQKKALNELTVADFDAFSRFLAWPEPADNWICSNGTARESHEWRPLTRPLQPSSVLTAMRTLNPLLQFLRQHNYANLHMAHRIRDQRSGHSKTAPTTENGKWSRPSRALRPEHWVWIESSLDQGEFGEFSMREQLVMYLIHYGSLKLSEVEAIKYSDLRPPTSRRACWWIKLNNGSRQPWGRCLVLNEPLQLVMNQWLGLPAGRDWSARSGYVVPEHLLFEPLLGGSASEFSGIVKKVLHRSAALASTAGNLTVAGELTALTSSAIRRANLNQRLSYSSFLQILRSWDRYFESTAGDPPARPASVHRETSCCRSGLLGNSGLRCRCGACEDLAGPVR